MSGVVNRVGVDRELTPDPGGVGQRAERAGYQIPVRRPRGIPSVPGMGRAVAQLGVPFAPPVGAGRGRHEHRHRADDAQREPQGEPGHHDERAGRSRRTREAITRGTG
jgi:hypothetical protein